MSTAIPANNLRFAARATGALRPLTLLERGLLALGVFEIPLQIDTYLMFREADANLGAVAGINVSVTTICLAALYWIWISGAAAARSGVKTNFIVGLPMLVYLSAVAFSIIVAQVGSLALFDLALLVQAYLLFFYIANRVSVRADLIFCMLVLGATVFLQSVIIFGLSAMGGAVVGTDFNVGPIVLTVWDDGRPAGTMHSAVLAGSVLALLWVPVAALILADAPKSVRQLAFIAAVAGLFAILLTQTRTAIFTTAIAGGVIGIGLLSRGWLPKWAIVMAFVLLVASSYPLYRVVQNRVQGDDNGSASARLHLSAIAGEMIADQPIFGVGAGNCHLAGQRYADQSKYRAEWYYTIHCKYLLVWIETGVLGILTFLWVLFSGVRNALSAWVTRDRLLAPLGLAIAAGICGQMLHMFVDVFNSRTQVQTLWVMLGLAAAVAQIARREARSRTGGLHHG